MFMLRKCKKSELEDLLNNISKDDMKSFSLVPFNKNCLKSSSVIKNMMVVADGDDLLLHGGVCFFNTNNSDFVYCAFLCGNIQKDKNIIKSFIDSSVLDAKYNGYKAMLIYGQYDELKKYGFQKASDFNISISNQKNDDLLVLFLNESIENIVVDADSVLFNSESEFKDEKIEDNHNNLNSFQRRYKLASRIVLVFNVIIFITAVFLVAFKRAIGFNDGVSFLVMCLLLGTSLISLGVLNLIGKRKINALFGFISGGALYILGIIFLYL